MLNKNTVNPLIDALGVYFFNHGVRGASIRGWASIGGRANIISIDVWMKHSLEKGYFFVSIVTSTYNITHKFQDWALSGRIWLGSALLTNTAQTFNVLITLKEGDYWGVGVYFFNQGLRGASIRGFTVFVRSFNQLLMMATNHFAIMRCARIYDKLFE